VRDPGRREKIFPRFKTELLVAEKEGDLTHYHEETFVLATVHMRRRTGAGPKHAFHHGVGARRIFPVLGRNTAVGVPAHGEGARTLEGNNSDQRRKTAK
jgi:hypothetical protein